MSQDSSVSLGDIEKFAQKHGRKRTEAIMAALGKNVDFYNAVHTPVGQEILKDLMAMMEEKLALIVDGTATEEQRIEYKVMHALFGRWGTKIQRYTKNLHILKEGQK